MTWVTHAEILEYVLQSERAVLVLHAEWSVPSVTTTSEFESWDRSSGPDIAAVRCETFIASTDLEFVRSWLKSHPRLKHNLDTGWGEILWLQRGEIIEILFHTHRQPITEQLLSQNTLKLWGSNCKSITPESNAR